MKEFFENLKYVWKFAKDAKRKFIGYFIISAVQIIPSIVFPFLSASLIVNLTSNNIYQFILIGIALLIGNLINHLMEFYKRKMYEQVSKTMRMNIQTSLGTEILKLSNKSLEENGSGGFIQRLSFDTENLSTIFTEVNNYVNGILTNVGILVTYFFLSKIVFTFVLVAFIIRLIIEHTRINVLQKNKKLYKKHSDTMTGFTSEIIRGAEDIKMLNGEESFLKELKTRFNKLNEEKYQMGLTDYRYLLVRWIWAETSWFILILIIGLSVNAKTMTVATGVVLFNFGNRYNALVGYITRFHELIKSFNLSATRVFEIFNNEKYQKEKFGTKHLDYVNGDFEFKKVSFSYENNDVLKNLSFKVNANETVAFVGKSGAGKTTIFKLLCKMYDNYKGVIKIDGIDIKELDKDSIRGNITIVSQNPYIFNMSIKDNLRLVKEDITDEEIHEACKMACLDDFVETLPNKYDTIVGEGGINLSGGQKQRLAIARAFVQKTEIIFFDEATSALDNETQLKIQQAIDNLKKDYTILIIAHRLSTIKNADRILMIDNGEVIAEGNHKQLLKDCKAYKNLYDTEITKIDDIKR